MTHQTETVAERREHAVRLRRTLLLCTSSRQRRAVRDAIRHAAAEDRATRP